MTEQLMTGKPPMGEPGICVLRVDGADYFSFWSDRFGWRDGAQAAWALRDNPAGSQRNQGWRWATRPEVLAAGVPESEVEQMLHKSQRGELPRWTDMAPGDPAPVQMIEVGIGTLWSDGEPLWYENAKAEHVPWDIPADQVRVIGYSFNEAFVRAEREKYLARLKAEQQPSQAEVESTQKPEQDTERDRQQDEAARSDLQANDRMLKRDLDGAAPQRQRPIPKRPKITRAGALRLIEDVRRFDREENTSANAFVEWPADHRCGGWGAL